MYDNEIAEIFFINLFISKKKKLKIFFLNIK